MHRGGRAIMEYCYSNKVCKIFQDEPLLLREITPNISVRLIKKKIPDMMVSNAESAANVMRDLRDKDREEFRVLHLDSKNGVIGSEQNSIGTLNSALVHPREVFKAAILNNANALIVGHNHPSGDAKPSVEDEIICQKLIDSGNILNIKVLDCLVIGAKTHASCHPDEKQLQKWGLR